MERAAAPPCGVLVRKGEAFSPSALEYLVLHSVTAPARVSRAVFPLIQNSMALSAYLPPSAEGACGSETLPPLTAKVSSTDPVGPGALKRA